MNEVSRPLGKFRPNPKLKLREQLAEVMRFKHFSHRTENAYWHWIKGFILFHQKRHPRELGAAEGGGRVNRFAPRDFRKGDHVLRLRFAIGIR